MKKIIFLFVIVVNVFMIYVITINKDIYYLSLGDYMALGVNDQMRITNGYNGHIRSYLEHKGKLKTFNDEFVVNNYHTTDLINAIMDNKKINTTIQNALIKADLTSLSIGNNDLLFELQGTNNFDEIINDMDQLFSLIRKYTKEEVIVNSFHYPYDVRVTNIEEKVIFMNKRLYELCQKYNFIYNDIYDIVQGNYPTDENYKAIAENIVKNSLLSNI